MDINNRLPQEEEPKEGWEHLRSLGYAPGDYLSRCVDCKKVCVMDKRALRCFKCAQHIFSSRQEALKIIYNR